MREKIIIVFIIILLINISATVSSDIKENQNDVNYDPLVDIEVTVEIQKIRYLEDAATQSTTKTIGAPGQNRLQLFRNLVLWHLNKNRIVENKPSMYVKVFINDVEFKGPVYPDTYYTYEPNFKATLNVPNNKEFVDITIQLWDSTDNGDIPLDISPIADKYEANMKYSVKTGHWTGDNYLGSPSGYGRLNGCDDGSIYETDRDCELWFDIYQNTYDGSGIPYWIQVYEYNTDPAIDDTGTDFNCNGIPIEWEWKYGYDPFSYEDHANIDPSGDAITNYEKYLTWEYGSDPLRKEVFVQLDVMEEGPDGEKTYFPERSIELLKTAFNRQNIMIYIDTGEEENQKTVPFYDKPSWFQIREIYDENFIKDESEKWREKVFHYALILHDVPSGMAPGFAFRRNAFAVSSQGMEGYAQRRVFGSRDVIYASCFMHEIGHTFNFRPIPGHDYRSIHIWQPLFWFNLPYNSCMSYNWIYQIVDYSDGSGPAPDLNDWERIDYYYFKQ